LAALKLYCGNNYGDFMDVQKTYVNLLALTIEIYMRNLVARAPKVLVTTAYPDLKPFATNYELACNKLISDICLGKSLRTSVLNAMFGMGVHKIGLNQSKTVEIGGVTHDVGQPFADAVSLDDWVHDMTAKRVEQFQYCGDLYLADYKQVQESGQFKNTDDMDTDVRRVIDQEGQERSESLSQWPDSDSKTYRPQVQLLDLWLPLDGKAGIIVTLDAMNETKPPMRTVEWEGPELGPYKLLQFQEVPENIMPLPPVAKLLDLHKLVNQIYLKLSDQAKRQKTLLGYRSAAVQDASRISQHNDGDSIMMDSPEGAKEFRFGGIDNQTLAFAINVKDIYSWIAGNLDSMGGLSAMSGTASQDKLLAENSSRAIADMQDAVMDWTKSIVSDLAYYLISDPLIQMPLTKRVPGTDLSIPTTFNPEGKSEDFIKYNFDIEPYSMQHSTPQSKLATIMNFIATVYVPMMQQMSEQGLMLDMRGITRLLSKYSDVPELFDLVVSMSAPVGPQTSQVGEPPAKAPVTTRNYVRENRPAPTRPGRDNAMMQTLMGGGVQESEMKGALS